MVLEIFDRDTGEWWDGSAWQVARSSFDAVLDAPGAASSGWSYSFDPPSVSSQPYWVTVRSFDAAGNASAYAYTNFTVLLSDVSAPLVSVYGSGELVVGCGSGGGCRGRRLMTRGCRRWCWRSLIVIRVSGGMVRRGRWRVRRLMRCWMLPGEASSGWSYSFDPASVSSQPYWVTVRSFDAAGNASAYAYTNFTVLLSDVSVAVGVGDGSGELVVGCGSGGGCRGRRLMTRGCRRWCWRSLIVIRVSGGMVRRGRRRVRRLMRCWMRRVRRRRGGRIALIRLRCRRSRIG